MPVAGGSLEHLGRVAVLLIRWLGYQWRLYRLIEDEHANNYNRTISRERYLLLKAIAKQAPWPP